MKISYNWLKQYLSSDIEPSFASELLTGCGLEVEGMEKIQSVKGGLEGIVIGEVLTCTKHPNADKLSVTTVNVGANEPLKIVCGASNVAARQKVLVATIGTTIYKGNDSFQIQKAKLRGEVSEGMICAEDELGLGTSHAGILVLDASAPVGQAAKEYFNITEDVVFEIGLTANRSDATSHIGVARDLIAVLNTRCMVKNNDFSNSYSLKRPSVEDFQVDNHDLPIEISIENEDCPRYTGITISGVEVKESPAWLQEHLKSIGLRSINNLVDISNFILFETGQPLHFFDADKIAGNKVVIKKLQPGTRFFTLDGTERTLTGKELMICNAQEGMCIAGVYGGLKSGITEKTKNIFIESAYFNPVSIRKTAKHHGLQTDASFRYERGADPDITVYAIKRAALLIKEFAEGKISSEIVDVYPSLVAHFKVELSYRNLDRLCGKSIERDVVKNILKLLEIQIAEENSDGLLLLVPPFKADVRREADVVEEILRVYGYNNIEIDNVLHTSISQWECPDKEKIKNTIANYLTSVGFSEIMCNSLSKSEYIRDNSFFESRKNVAVANPLSKDLDVMRQTLLFGGLETLVHNLNRKVSDIKVYEFGKIYYQNPGKETEKDVLKRYTENERLAIFLTGNLAPESWYAPTKESGFFHLKAMVHAVMQRVGILFLSLKQEEASGYFSKGLTYHCKYGKLVEFGKLQAAILKRFDIKQSVYYADFDWQMYLKLAGEDVISYKELPRFPEVRRDLALLIDKKIQFSEIEAIANRIGKPLLKKVSLFDVYQGENIGKDKKSYAVSFILQDPEKTLNDKEIELVMEKLMIAFHKELNALLR